MFIVIVLENEIDREYRFSTIDDLLSVFWLKPQDRVRVYTWSKQGIGILRIADYEISNDSNQIAILTT